MNKINNYLKILSVFLIVELMLNFVISLLNLIGLNSGITAIIIFISNIFLFFILSYLNASKIRKKGFFEGILIGLLLILIMILIKIIFFAKEFSISSFIYYSILFIISIIGGMFGVNKKSDK